MPKLSELLFGGKDKIKKAKTLSPEQEELMALITEGLKTGQGPLADIFGGFNKQAFEEGVTQPALKNFQENILPMIQEKFIAGNQVAGSGMRRGQLKAATDLQSQLAALMYQAQQDAIKNRSEGLKTSLGTQTFQNIYQQGKSGIIPAFIQGAGQGLGQAATRGISNLFSGENAIAPPVAGGQAGVIAG